MRNVYTTHKKHKKRWWYVTVLLVILLSLLSVSMLLFGSTRYSLKEMVQVMSGEELPGASFAILSIRLPRMLAGLGAGIAFGMAGSTFQTMLKNPLASPDMIGVTSGASVAAVYCILVLKTDGSHAAIAAVVSGLVVSMAIYLFSRKGSFSGARLILIGIGIQAMMQAVISFLLLKSSQYDVPAALRWLSGSLNGVQKKDLPLFYLILAVFGGLILCLGRHLKILELGEYTAIALGMKTDSIRVILVISGVILIAFATAITGPIAFVAFLSGPIAVRLTGYGISHVLPAGLVGAFLVLAADLLGQFAFPVRFPVGIITGVLGAPYLLYLLVKMNQGGRT